MNQNEEEPKLTHPETPLNHVPGQGPHVAPADSGIPPVAGPATPTVEPSYARPLQGKPKKTYNPKRFVIIVSVIVGACLLGVAIMVLFALLPMVQSSKVEPPKAPDTNNTQKTLSAKQAIDNVKEYFKGTEVAKSGIILPVRATGKDYYTVIPDAAATTSVAGEVAPDKAQAQLASVVHSLESGDEFTKRVVSDAADGGNYLADFSRKETFCEVAMTVPENKAANRWLEVRCADMATYVEYATAQEPLVRLYTPLSATSVLYGFVGKPAPKPSKTTGYNLAELPVSIVVDSNMTSSGKYALYYQTPDGLWHYFKDRDASAAYECDQYNTDPLRAAYTGVACRDNKNQPATVQPPKARS